MSSDYTTRHSVDRCDVRPAASFPRRWRHCCLPSSLPPISASPSILTASWPCRPRDAMIAITIAYYFAAVIAAAITATHAVLKWEPVDFCPSYVDSFGSGTAFLC